MSHAAGTFTRSPAGKCGTLFPAELAAMPSNLFVSTIVFLKNDPALLEFGSSGSMTIDFARRILRIASRVSLKVGRRSAKYSFKSLYAIFGSPCSTSSYVTESTTYRSRWVELKMLVRYVNPSRDYPGRFFFASCDLNIRRWH